MISHQVPLGAGNGIEGGVAFIGEPCGAQRPFSTRRRSRINHAGAEKRAGDEDESTAGTATGQGTGRRRWTDTAMN